MVVPLGNGRRAISCRFLSPCKTKKVNKLDKFDTFFVLALFAFASTFPPKSEYLFAYLKKISFLKYMQNNAFYCS